ncbi:MAG TPA: MFS transporter [Gemmatimonadales bacterium]|nr:MFS transporter [Gemmatimonadales bacterium]
MSEPAPAISARDQLRRLWVLIATNFVDMIGFAIVLPLLPFYALRLHATAFEVGIIISAFSIAQILSSPLWGRVSDTYGRRPALLIGLGASALAYVVFGVADALWLLFASRLIQGAGGGTTGVAQAYVADTIEPAQRARALGWLSAATSAGVMLGPVIGSFATKFGPEAPGFLAAALCLLNAGFAWRWLPESRRKDGSGAHATAGAPVWRAGWEVVRHPTRAVPRLILIYAGGMLAFAALTSVLALYLDAEFGVTEQSIGFVFLYIGGLSVVMRTLCLGPIVDRIGEPRAMQVGTLSLIAGLALFPQAGSFWGLAAVMPLVPIGTALLFPATTSLISRHTRRSEYGTVMGVAQTFAGLSRVVAPLVATAAFERLGHASPFYMAAGFIVLMSLLVFRVGVQPAGMKPAPASAPDIPT